MPAQRFVLRPFTDADIPGVRLAATGNAASQKVAVSAGYRREGILRSAGITHSGRAGLVMFSEIPEDLPQ